MGKTAGDKTGVYTKAEAEGDMTVGGNSVVEVVDSWAPVEDKTGAGGNWVCDKWGLGRKVCDKWVCNNGLCGKMAVCGSSTCDGDVLIFSGHRLQLSETAPAVELAQLMMMMTMMM